MKKIILVLVVLFASLSIAQDRVVVFNEGTVANSAGVSTHKTGYLDFSSWKVVDSITVSLIGQGEINIDSVDVYGSIKIPGGAYKKDATLITTFSGTIDLADGVTDIEVVGTLAGSDIKGFNAIYYDTRGDSDGGNDATDPNNLWVAFQIWGTP